jgi:RluA family pseudouridine synthase
MTVQQFQVTRKHQGTPLVAFLAEELGISRKKSKDLLDHRAVFVNSQRTWMAKHSLKYGDSVEVHAPSRHQTRLRILHRDEHYMVVDKPAGILAVGADSIETRIQRKYPKTGIRAAHRLDRDTSGCLLFARSEKAFEAAKDIFRAKEISKVYHAIVRGRLPSDWSRMDAPIDGQKSATVFTRLNSSKDASYLKILLITGRTHQIRRHMADAGHPVLGDREYDRGRIKGKQKTIPRQMLHAASLSFTSPFTNKKIYAKSHLPPDFRQCLKDFGLTK